MTGTTEYDFATGRGTLRGYSRSIAFFFLGVCVLFDFSEEGSPAVAASSDTLSPLPELPRPSCTPSVSNYKSFQQF